MDVWVEGPEEPITSTSRHPFWSISRSAWIPAFDLRTGELLETKDGGCAQVVSISLRDNEGRVYNLEVAKKHEFRITASGIAVHNSSFTDSQFNETQAFDFLSKVRRELNMPEAGSEMDEYTLSLLQIDNRFFVGVNAGVANADAVAGTLQKLAGELGHKGPTFQLLRHSEGDSLFQAFSQGVGQGRTGTMWVDRDFICQGCKSGLDNMRKLVGLKGLTVVPRGGTPLNYPRIG